MKIFRYSNYNIEGTIITSISWGYKKNNKVIFYRKRDLYSSITIGSFPRTMNLTTHHDKLIYKFRWTIEKEKTLHRETGPAEVFLDLRDSYVNRITRYFLWGRPCRNKRELMRKKIEYLMQKTYS